MTGEGGSREGTRGRDRLLPHHSCDAIYLVSGREEERAQQAEIDCCPTIAVMLYLVSGREEERAQQAEIDCCPTIAVMLYLVSGREEERAQQAEIDCCPITADAIPCVWKRRREGTAGWDRLLPHHSRCYTLRLEEKKRGHSRLR